MTTQEVLAALRIGRPITGESSTRFLTQATDDAIRPAIARVHALRGRAAAGEKASFWITGQPGNGKSQCLIRLQNCLRQTDGLGKYAYVHIKLDQERELARQPGLHITLHFPFTGVAVGEIEAAREAAGRLSRLMNSATVDALALGMDAIARLSGCPVPIGIGIKHVIRKAIGYDSVKRGIVRRRLEAKWPSNPKIVDFVMHWAAYLMSPTPAQRVRFRDYINRLGTESFDLLCAVLEATGYTTLVVILDEAKLDAIHGLKGLWDGPAHEEPPLHKLNQVYVFACPDSERQKVLNDPSLRRRFCATSDGYSPLNGPRIGAGPSDDFDHVDGKIEELLGENASLKRRTATAAELDTLRMELSSREDLTWQILWSRLVDLRIVM